MQWFSRESVIYRQIDNYFIIHNISMDITHIFNIIALFFYSHEITKKDRIEVYSKSY